MTPRKALRAAATTPIGLPHDINDNLNTPAPRR
jgi:hypothetical protein